MLYTSESLGKRPILGRGLRVAAVLCCAGLAACGAARPQSATSTDAGAGIAPSLAAAARRLAAGGTAASAAASAGRPVHVNSRGQIEVYVHVVRVAPQTTAALAAAGADIEQAVPALNIYQAWIDVRSLARLTTVAGVTRISLPAYALEREPAGG